jgi:hypothetical protein
MASFGFESISLPVTEVSPTQNIRDATQPVWQEAHSHGREQAAKFLTDLNFNF